MAKKIDAPHRIPAEGGKIIDEYIGRVGTGDDRVSIAHMQAPPGWAEPAQTPEFTEYTIVLKGSVVVEHAGGTDVVSAGQAFVSEPGERVRYSAGPSGAEYIAVCLPAFSPDTVHRDQ
jgi:quercetin dioxygenase-like cupin family protein